MTMKAFVYARFSSDNQREESIEAQLRAIHDYAERNGIEIVHEYTDEAKSATTDKRPAFQRMFADLPGSGIGMVIVHKLDRFSRDRYDSAFYKRELKQAGVRLVSVLEPLDGSPESIILESVLEGMAEYYSRNLARETMKGLMETAYKCKHTGGIPPLGYTLAADKTYVIEPSEAEVVRQIFSMYADGRGYDDIIEALRTRRTKSGGAFAKNSISSILRNEKYIGTFVFNRTSRSAKNSHKSKPEEDIVRIVGGVPRIIDDVTWNRVQERLSDNKHNAASGAKNIYLLTGKLFCGKCGAAMVGTTTTSGQSKTKYSYYVCGNRDRSRTCDLPRISASRVEGAVLNAIENRLSVCESNIDIILRMVLEQAGEEPPEIVAARSELATVKRQSAALVAAIKDGAYHPSMKNELSALMERETVLVNTISASRPLEPTTREDVAAFLATAQNIKKLSRIDQRAAISSLVERVTVFDEDDIHIDFRIFRAPNGAPPRNQITKAVQQGGFCYLASCSKGLEGRKKQSVQWTVCPPPPGSHSGAGCAARGASSAPISGEAFLPQPLRVFLWDLRTLAFYVYLHRLILIQVRSRMAFQKACRKSVIAARAGKRHGDTRKATSPFAS